MYSHPDSQVPRHHRRRDSVQRARLHRYGPLDVLDAVEATGHGLAGRRGADGYVGEKGCGRSLVDSVPVCAPPREEREGYPSFDIALSSYYTLCFGIRLFAFCNGRYREGRGSR